MLEHGVGEGGACGPAPRARPIIGFTDIFNRYRYRYIGSVITNIGIGIIGIGIGICYNSVIGYNIGIK